MRVINARNVNEAVAIAGPLIAKEGEFEDTRNGPAMVFPTPVCTVYSNPTERVLFWSPRKANPFFHLFEAFWMLAGRRDAAFLNRYVKDFGARYAEPNGDIHDAYGWRWMHHFDGIDQLTKVSEMLRADISTRRAVLTMFDPLEDLGIGVNKRSVPCNTQVYFRARLTDDAPAYLDATVCCRSNDAVWGAFGANVVHMSVMLEYVAWRTDLQVGTLYQISNNLHVYENTAHLLPSTPEEALSVANPYATTSLRPIPLFDANEDGDFRLALDEWLELPSDDPPGCAGTLFHRLLVPMSRAHDALVLKNYKTARQHATLIRDEDWRFAVHQFIDRVEK